MKIKKEEKISFYTHFFGILASIAGAVILFNMTNDSSHLRIIAFVYIISALFLFSASSLYHAYKKQDDEINIRRTIDHMAIFIMIAGSYTPFCFLYLQGAMLWGILITQWTFVLIGFFFKIFYLNAPRVFYTIIYVIMGWVVIIPMKQLIENIPFNLIAIVFLGGIFYTVGAVFYALKRPKQIRGIFGFHEIFHIFILLGAISHFIAVYGALENNI